MLELTHRPLLVPSQSGPSRHQSLPGSTLAPSPAVIAVECIFHSYLVWHSNCTKFLPPSLLQPKLLQHCWINSTDFKNLSRLPLCG